MPDEICFRDLGHQDRSLADLNLPNPPSQFSLQSWDIGEDTPSIDIEAQHHFGFVAEGQLKIVFNGLVFPLTAGMYFSIPGCAALSQDPTSCFPRSKGILISQSGYQGLFQIGGPIESTGRLQYIDGCSDTLLISPVRKGDACLNFLHLPAETNQTSHTHPSFRFGAIVSGEGYCESDNGTERLTPGKIFYIPPEGQHRFRTQDSSLSVIAFHPDSDFGPDDCNHPMVNKTIVNGVPASKLSLAQRNL